MESGQLKSIKDLRPGLLKGVVLFVFAVYFLYLLAVQSVQIFDLNLLHEEFSILFPQHALGDSSLFQGDYLFEYLTAAEQPRLYTLFSKMALKAGIGLIEYHRWLSVTLWVLTLSGIGFAAWRLQQFYGLLLAIGLTICQPLFLYQITSATPHAFAFPLLAWTLASLVNRSSTGLVVLTLLAAALYPVMAPICGLSLFGLLLIENSSAIQRLDRRIIAKVMIITALTGICAISLGSTIFDSKEGFGTPLTPLERADEFPENGSAGRHFLGVTDPGGYLLDRIDNQYKDTISHGVSWAITGLYLLSAILGYFLLSRTNFENARVGIYIVSSVVVLYAIFWTMPYNAYRFVLYPFWVLLPILAANTLVRLADALPFGRASSTVPLALVLMFAISIDSLHPNKIGYWLVASPETREALQFVQSSPKNSVFAGWPSMNGVGNWIPYLTGRQSLVMEKAHYPSHVDYVLTMRSKMNALIDGYFARTQEPLTVLGEDYGVSHLILDKAHFHGEQSSARYFAPFQERIEEITPLTERPSLPVFLATCECVVFENSRYVILDLSRLGSPRGRHVESDLTEHM